MDDIQHVQYMTKLINLQPYPNKKPQLLPRRLCSKLRTLTSGHYEHKNNV